MLVFNSGDILMEEDESFNQQKIFTKPVIENIKTLMEEKKYHKASEILKIQLQNNPKQKEFIKLYSELKHRYRNDKIQKLQQEADMYLRSGNEDKAQEKFREIFKLDPTRTELKHSFRKTRGEIVKEYDKRVFKTEMVSLCTKAFFAVAIILSIVSACTWYINNKHLEKSEKYIISWDLEKAREEVNKCSRFFCGRKKEVLNKLQSTVDGLISRAHESIESKNFAQAKDYLDLAARGVENDFQIKEEINKCDQQETLWKQELVRQEQQKLLSEKAMFAKIEYEKILNQAIESSAEIEAGDILETAKIKCKEAETLYQNNEFEASENKWLTAIEDCQRAMKVTAGIIERKNATLVFKSDCDEIVDKGTKINAPAEANETWKQGLLISNNAEQSFVENKLEEAAQLWEQAKNKFNEAIELTKQEPNYTKALTFVKKWSLLKTSLNEENIRKFYGAPKCVQADSDKCIWYYQSLPTTFKNSQGNYEFSIPESGYICFSAVSVQVLIDRNNEAYQKQVIDENRMHERAISDLNRQIENENSRYRNYNSSKSKIASPTYSRSNNSGWKNSGQSYGDESQRHANQINQLNKAIEKEKQRHQARIEKLQNENDAKINDLANGLTPREPRYFVAEWKVPDTDNLICFMETDSQKSEKAGIEAKFKWQVPVKWRSLKLNIREEDVFKVLGEPDAKYEENGTLVYCYGKLGEYGVLKFEKCADAINRLRHWKEPLWAHVTGELIGEKIISENE